MLRLGLLLALCLPAASYAVTPVAPPKVEPVLDRPNLKVVRITLEPGAPLPTHSTPYDATVSALAGSGEVTIGEKTEPLATHGTIFLPRAIPHGVRNTGKTPLVLLVHHLKTTP